MHKVSRLIRELSKDYSSKKGKVSKEIGVRLEKLAEEFAP